MPDVLEDPESELLGALGEEQPADGASLDEELDRLDPVPEILTLSTGTEVRILRLGTRQLFRLLRIITHGAGPNLMQTGIDFRDEPEVFAGKFMGLVLFSIPDAEEEAISFLQSICEPVGLSGKKPRDLSEKERAAEIALWTELSDDLSNPPPEDTLDIVETVVRREAPELAALGKRLRGFLQLAQKTGQLRQGAPASPEPGSQAVSPARSTSSPASTDGATSRSSASRSAGSGRSPRQSGSASGRRSAAAAR
jgi:hypothetical protein